MQQHANIPFLKLKLVVPLYICKALQKNILQVYPCFRDLRILAKFPERARKSQKSELKMSLKYLQSFTDNVRIKFKQQSNPITCQQRTRAAIFILWSKFFFVLLSCTTTICCRCFASSFHRTKRSARAQCLLA